MLGAGVRDSAPGCLCHPSSRHWGAAVVQAPLGRHCLGIGGVWLEALRLAYRHPPDDSAITKSPTPGRRPIEHYSRLLAIPRLARMAPLPTAVRSTSQIARKALQQRSISDVAITRTGKPILRVQGGRFVGRLTLVAAPAS